MKISLRQKEHFYHELGQLIRSGISFTGALETLSSDSHGPMRRLLRRLKKSINAGHSVGDAFRAQRGAVGEMETGIVAASAQSGQFDQGCRYLSGYFASMEKARAAIIKGCLYPAFILHLGIFLPDLDEVIAGKTGDYLRQCLGRLAVVYIAGIFIYLFASTLLRSAETSGLADEFLRAIPVLGGLRRALMLERFAATYDMQLRAGINVFDSLSQAARASQSARIISAIRKIIPKVREGGQVGPLLSKYSVFDKDLVRAIRVGEETGALDEELARMTVYFREFSARRIALVSEWAGRLLYIAIALYVGYRIIAKYQEVYKGVSKQFDL